MVQAKLSHCPVQCQKCPWPPGTGGWIPCYRRSRRPRLGHCHWLTHTTAAIQPCLHHPQPQVQFWDMGLSVVGGEGPEGTQDSIPPLDMGARPLSPSLSVLLGMTDVSCARGSTQGCSSPHPLGRHRQGHRGWSPPHRAGSPSPRGLAMQ